MNKRTMVITLLVTMMFAAICSCDKEGSGHIESSEGLSATEKYQAKQFYHSELIKTFHTTDVKNLDINRQLYLLQALIRQIEVYEKCSEAGAYLTMKAVNLESAAITHELPDILFLRGQSLFIEEKFNEAQLILSQYLDQNDENTDALNTTARIYVNAIESGIGFSQLFIAKDGEGSTDKPGCLSGEAIEYPQLILSDFDVFSENTYDCAEGRKCDWEVVDLSIYPYLKSRMLHEILPLVYGPDTLKAEQSQEELFIDLLGEIARSYLYPNAESISKVLNRIEEKNLKNKRPFTTYYQIANSIRLDLEEVAFSLATTEPLTLLRILNRNDNLKVNKNYLAEIYVGVLPHLFDASLSTPYRDYIYVELWDLLWREDIDMLESFRLRKGFSPGVVSPDFFLDLLPYRVLHPKENGLGNRDLKTQVQHHPYLRPLIRSYEYLAVKSMSTSVSKTGVG